MIRFRSKDAELPRGLSTCLTKASLAKRRADLVHFWNCATQMLSVSVSLTRIRILAT